MYKSLNDESFEETFEEGAIGLREEKREELCKKQSNPYTKKPFKDCQERLDVFCRVKLDDLGESTNTQTKCYEYEEYLKRESCKKSLKSEGIDITQIDPEKYCEELSCSRTTHEGNLIYNKVNSGLPCAQKTQYQNNNTNARLMSSLLEIFISVGPNQFPLYEEVLSGEVDDSVIKELGDNVDDFPESYIQESYDTKRLSPAQIQAIENHCKNNPGDEIATGVFCPGETESKSKLGLILGTSIGGSILIALIIYFIVSRRN